MPLVSVTLANETVDGMLVRELQPLNIHFASVTCPKVMLLLMFCSDLLLKNMLCAFVTDEKSKAGSSMIPDALNASLAFVTLCVLNTLTVLRLVQLENTLLMSVNKLLVVILGDSVSDEHLKHKELIVDALRKSSELIVFSEVH